MILDRDTGDVLLASGNQDSFIRVWRFKSLSQVEAQLEQNKKISDLAPNEDIETKRVIFSSGVSTFYSVTVETILAGHDDKVFAVQWCQSSKDDDLKLVSASLDKTIILWEQDKDADGLWIESVRVGEVGGNTLGKYVRPRTCDTLLLMLLSTVKC